jgi:UDP-N-acetylmuramyl pentapeptide phosphotransferase/UDP-N-acetylglucosamine-1-phosphate transferase
MDIIVIIAVTLIIARLLMHNIIKMLVKTNKGICTAVNYNGRHIPAIGGIVFIPILLVAILLLLLNRPENFVGYISYLTLVLSMGFVGIIDDLIGVRSIKGLFNHIRSTLKGTITTGFLKALTGLLVSWIICLGMTRSYFELVLNVLIISLFANTINLFDLRPGRAIKVYMSMSLVLLIAAAGRLTEAVPVIILDMAALCYIVYDLREICMLGDTGANILGITLGYYSSLFLGFKGKLIILALLVFINLMAERLSISSLINRNKVLSYLDSLGREKSGTNDRCN